MKKKINEIEGDYFRKLKDLEKEYVENRNEIIEEMNTLIEREKVIT